MGQFEPKGQKPKRGDRERERNMWTLNPCSSPCHVLLMWLAKISCRVDMMAFFECGLVATRSRFFKGCSYAMSSRFQSQIINVQGYGDGQNKNWPQKGIGGKVCMSPHSRHNVNVVVRMSWKDHHICLYFSISSIAFANNDCMWLFALWLVFFPRPSSYGVTARRCHSMTTLWNFNTLRNLDVVTHMNELLYA